MFYLKLWFYVIGALAYGPFETQAECEDTRAYHERQAKQPASEPCFQGWEERGLTMHSPHGSRPVSLVHCELPSSGPNG